MKNTRKYRAFLALAVTLTVGAGYAQQLSSQSRILRVSKLDETDPRVEGRPDLSAWRSVKFFDETELPLGKEVYEVEWAPPANGLEAGAVLLFEYRRTGDQMIKSQNIKYPFSVYEVRTTTFVLVPSDAYEEGEVIMWRARLIRKGRLLAELASDSWR